MKTSIILALLAVVTTLSGLITTDILLKQKYDKIDWQNPYQFYKSFALSNVKHIILNSAPTAEVIIEKGVVPQVLVTPDEVNHFKHHQQGDTLFIAYAPDYAGWRDSPKESILGQLPIGLVLKLPQLPFIKTINSRITLHGFNTGTFLGHLEESRIRTDKSTLFESFNLTLTKGSFALLESQTLVNLRVNVQDSSGVDLNDTDVTHLTTIVSSKAEIGLRGKALKWLSIKL